jgi:hypothetical protein
LRQIIKNFHKFENSKVTVRVLNVRPCTPPAYRVVPIPDLWRRAMRCGGSNGRIEMNLKDGHRQMVHETERLQKEMSAKWIDTFRRVAVPDRGEVCCACKNVFGIFWPELSSSIAMTGGSGSNTIFKIRG